MTIPYSTLKQVRAVLLVELAIFGIIGALLYWMWSRICGDGILECLTNRDRLSVSSFLLLSLLRPFLLTPSTFFHLVAGNTFGFWGGIAFSLLSTLFSCIIIFLLGKHIGKKLVTPWLRSNLPQTYQFVKSQGYKLVFFSRLMPFMHFDLCSLVFGIIDLRFRAVVIATLLGELPMILVTNYISSGGAMSPAQASVLALISVVVMIAAIGILEFVSRMRGKGLYFRLMAMYHELLYEVKVNNEIVKRYTINPNKTPILLLYGFFSSRRTLTILERQLTAKGYDVLSFNLGGLFGVFFTRGILETSRYIDEKLKRQFARKNFSKLHIVAHSKGGLVALWWLLKFSGYRSCHKVVCMGTPFQGSRLTYLGLVTPLGFLWRDLWQMRPGSRFLRDLSHLKVPKGVEIFCFYSNRDRVAPGMAGIFQTDFCSGKIHPVPMHNLSHFEFLYKREVADKIAELLGPASEELPATPPEASAASTFDESSATASSYELPADKLVNE